MKARRFGEEFEAQIIASIPRGVYKRKLRTPTPPVFEAPRLVQLIEDLHGLVSRMGPALKALVDVADPSGVDPLVPALIEEAAQYDEGVPHWVTASLRWSKFTTKAGFDLLMSAPAPHDPHLVELRDQVSEPMVLRIQPAILFALELKSVDGASLPFANVEKGQEKALREAAEANHVSGFLIEFRGPGEVWFIPIGAWDTFVATADRKSLPIAAARRVGMEVLADPYRGTSKPYWNIAAWIIECGGLLPEKPPKGKKKSGAAVLPGPAASAEQEGTAVPVPLSLFDL